MIYHDNKGLYGLVLASNYYYSETPPTSQIHLTHLFVLSYIAYIIMISTPCWHCHHLHCCHHRFSWALGWDAAVHRIPKDVYTNSLMTVHLHKGSNKINTSRGTRQGESKSPKLFVATLVCGTFRRPGKPKL